MPPGAVPNVVEFCAVVCCPFHYEAEGSGWQLALQARARLSWLKREVSPLAFNALRGTAWMALLRSP